MSKQILFFGSLLFLTSCGGWSESDRVAFVEKCEKAKFNYEYCECALEKATDKYSTFDAAIENEVEFGELIITCIDMDRIEEE